MAPDAKGIRPGREARRLRQRGRCSDLAHAAEQLDELRRFQKVTVDRELRMVELEAEIRALKERVRA